MYNKNRIIQKIGDGKLPDSATMKQIDAVHNFFLNKFVDYEKKVRMSEGMFYVTDNISEL
jgi:hypothetical protein